VGENLGEIQIARQEYVTMTAGIIADIVILGPYRTNRGPMDCLVACLD
jgi:hypothetical protein